LTGNHDDNHVYDNEYHDARIVDAERHAMLHRFNDTKVERIGTNQYFFFDFDNSDIGVRVICLDGLLGDGYPTGNNGAAWGYTEEQIEWVRDVALNTDKQVIFLSHVPLSSLYSDAYERAYPIVNSDELKTVIQNFINNSGTVIGFFNGHTHMDFMAVNNIGIHEVQTGCQNMIVSGTSGQKS
jgi:hypothetical protein